MQDPDVISASSGCATRYTPKACVYRTQLYAAIWLAARAKATALLDTHKHPNLTLDSPMASRIRGLLTYLLAAGAVSVRTTADVGNVKNCVPQLPKTSPAAIAYQLRMDEEAIKAAEGSLERPGAFTLDNLTSNAAAAVAQRFMTIDRGDMTALQEQPALLNRDSPLFVGDTFPRYADSVWPENILKGPVSPNLRLMWQAALNPPAAGMNNVKKPGYTTAEPFYVAWSNDVRTSIAPSEKGAPPGSSPRLSFESRYGFNKLNIGFDPTMNSFMFAKSYLSMVSVLAPAVTDAATDVIGRSSRLGIRDDVRQSFLRGWH